MIQKQGISPARMRDIVDFAMDKKFATSDVGGIFGWGFAELHSEEGDLLQVVEFANRITDVGDEYYAKRGIAAVAPAAPADVNKVTGMRLGTGVTAASKNGAGAAIVTYTTASQVAIDASFPTAATIGAGLGWRNTYKSTWGTGVATASGLAEVVITNETPITNVAGTAANTISRALLSPTVNKGANDTLAVTWQHDFVGA